MRDQGVLAVTVALLAACASDPPRPRDWEGADIEPVCEPGVARVTGEVAEAPIDLTIVENYGFQTYPALWAIFFSEDVRLTLVPNDLGTIAVGWSRGVLWRGTDEPLLCATHGSEISADPPRGQLRTLTDLGSCPGTEPLAGTIEGCTNPNAGCTATGGPLPEGGIDVTGSSFSQDATLFTFQLRLGRREVLDFDSERAGGTVYYRGDVVCVEDVAIVDRDTETHDFTFGGLSRLGRCDDGAPLSGFVDICLPQI